MAGPSTYGVGLLYTADQPQPGSDLPPAPAVQERTARGCLAFDDLTSEVTQHHFSVFCYLLGMSKEVQLKGKGIRLYLSKGCPSSPCFSRLDL